MTRDERDIDDKGEPLIRLTGATFDHAAQVLEAEGELAMMPGRLAVEMCPLPTHAHGLLMVARDEFTLLPDAGVVLAAPRGSRLRPGQAVILDHSHGMRLEGAVFGGYHAANEVRLLGYVPLSRGVAAPYSLRKSILMIESPNGLLVIGKRRFAPYADHVLVARDGLYERSEGGIWIPDEAQHGACKGTVVQAGARAFGPDEDENGRSLLLETGTRVVYSPNVAKGKDLRGIFADAEGSERFALVHIDAILATLPGEAAPDDFVERMVRVAEELAV